MQDTQAAIPHWVFTVLQGLALFVGGGTVVKLLTLYQNRNKPKVEIEKTEAETTEITIRSHSTAGESMMRMMDRLELALNTNDRLRNERDDLQEQVDKQQMELESYDRQMRRMKAILTLRNIKISDFDEPHT
jgi:hypothetical protein